MFLLGNESLAGNPSISGEITFNYLFYFIPETRIVTVTFNCFRSFLTILSSRSLSFECGLSSSKIMRYKLK